MENQLSSFKALIDFNNDVMRNFTDSSLKYYTDSINLLTEIKRGKLLAAAKKLWISLENQHQKN